MVYKITALDAIEELISAQSSYLFNNPKELQLILLEGFLGYQYLDPDELAEFYANIFSYKTKGHVQIVDSEDKTMILGCYQKLMVRDVDSCIKDKSKKLSLVKGKRINY